MRRKQTTVMAVALVTVLIAIGCGSPESHSETPLDPQRITEQIKASSTDGVLFDLKLGGNVLDSDNDGSFRDEIEVVSPDLTEFRGHISSPDGDLVILSCFAPECQNADRSAIFEVSYWTLK